MQNSLDFSGPFDGDNNALDFVEPFDGYNYDDLLQNSDRSRYHVRDNGQCHIYSLSRMTRHSVKMLKASIREVLMSSEYKDDYVNVGVMHTSRENWDINISTHDDYVNTYTAERDCDEFMSDRKYWGNEMTTSAAAVALSKCIIVVSVNPGQDEKCIPGKIKRLPRRG